MGSCSGTNIDPLKLTSDAAIWKLAQQPGFYQPAPSEISGTSYKLSTLAIAGGVCELRVVVFRVQ